MAKRGGFPGGGMPVPVDILPSRGFSASSGINQVLFSFTAP